MSNKKERILITQWNVKDNTCPVPVNSQCYTTKSCDDCKVGISKQEAIEVMAKAMFVILPRFSNLECEILAKEALNALLEGDK